MAEQQTAPATLEEAVAPLVVAWNNLVALPSGARLAHRLFGHALPGVPNSGGHGFSTLCGGLARTIGEAELAVIPGEIVRVRAEAEKAVRVAAGEE